MQPPVASRRPHSATHHGIAVEDHFAWLKDPGYPVVADPDVLAYVAEENAWFEAWMAPHAATVETLYEELKGRVKQDDEGVPTRDGDWDYWWKFATGGQYRIWLRRPAGGGDEQVILDEPALAGSLDYFRLGGLAVSPDGNRLAYAIDADGSERFTLRVRDLATGVEGEPITAHSIGSPVWTADSAALAWTEVDEKWRPFRVRLHRLDIGGEDGVLYEESDPSFFVGVGRSQDRSQIIVRAADHVTSELRLFPTAAPETKPLLVSSRLAGREYEVDVRGETLFIRTNDTHPNFRIATATLAAPGEWTELIAPSDDDYIRGITAFTSYLAIEERVDGLDAVRLRYDDGSEHRIAFPEPSFTAGLSTNSEPDAPLLRLSYSSMVTPQTVFDYDVAARTLVTRKVQVVPSGYDASAYATERLWATAPDGVKVPVSVVYRRDLPRDGSARLHLYGYGAYGITIPPGFSASRLSLLDRGFAYAIAHVRGGDDFGHRWYQHGKLDKRTNTFTDFVAAAHALIDAGFVKVGNISTSGGSAGGTLMGVVANSDPGLWRAVVAHVPFVDVLGTMLDDTLPLTPIEWPEWGNPLTDPAAFALIRSYSPYDNVTAQAYPAMLVTAGLNDPRVTYWEPAKWVARLRELGTGDKPLLLKTNMGAGHGGKSGRFEALRETAEEFAFILAAFDAPA
ncbi:S9 family peptidase [Glacieibacterium sp.]|uniref:S9 family peptidase n=1 Tax=Glacieibacterium sp. TaxID=2860237 RepID=UPI003AFF93ED